MANTPVVFAILQHVVFAVSLINLHKREHFGIIMLCQKLAGVQKSKLQDKGKTCKLSASLCY